MKIPRLDNKLWIIISIGVFLRLIWTLMRWDFLQVTVYDDAFYYFVIAKMIVTKGLVSADGITVTNGFHPLWLVTILPVWLFAKGIMAVRVVMGIALILDTVTVIFVYRLLLPQGRKTALWGAAIYFLNPVVISQVMSGMETPVVALMGVLWIYVVTRRKYGYLGLVAGLLFLARTDMIFLILAGFIFLWRVRHKIHWGQMIIGVIVASPWLLWNLSTFGTILQSSGSAYPWIYHYELFDYKGLTWLSPGVYGEMAETGWDALRHIGAYWGGLVVFIILGVFAVQARGPLWRKYGWALTGMVVMILIHAFIRWHIRIWYFHLLFIITLFWGVPVLISLSKRWRLVVIIFCCIGWIYILGKVYNSIGCFARAYVVQKRAMVASELINSLPDGAIVGAWNSGYPQYFAREGVTVINLDGLVNNDVLDAYRVGRLWDYLYAMRIEFIVDNQGYIDSFGRFIAEEYRTTRFREIKRVDDIGTRGNNMIMLYVELGEGKSKFGIRPAEEGK